MMPLAPKPGLRDDDLQNAQSDRPGLRRGIFDEPSATGKL
jgi:hypothetical protein